MRNHLLLLALFITASVSIHAQNTTGAAYFPTANYPNVNNLQIDNSGNYLMSIGVSSYVVFGADTFADSTHACVASVNAAGILNWVKPMGSGIFTGGAYSPPFLLYDKQGRTYVVGNTKNTTAVADTLVNYGAAGNFLARLNANGSLAWVKNIGSGLLPQGITEDNNNNLIICAANKDTAYIGPNTLLMDMVLAKFDTAGNLIWAKSAGAAAPFYTDWYQAICADSAGNIYAGGTYENNLLLDTVHFNLPQGWSGGFLGFVAKFDSNGQALWAEYAGDCVYSIAASPEDFVYVGGYSNANLIHEFDTVRAQYMNGWFIAKYRSNGPVDWVRGSPNSPEIVYQVACDQSGNCYATGLASDSFSILPDTMPIGQCMHGIEIAFVLELDTTGNLLWVKTPCGPKDASNGTAIAVNGCGIATAGRYSLSPLQIDTFVLPLLPSDSLHGHSYVYLWEMEKDSCHATLPTALADLTLADNLEVYPNPASGKFHILANTPNFETCRFNVLDVNGRQVSTGLINPGDNAINANLPSGIYLVNVFSSSTHMVKKLVIIN